MATSGDVLELPQLGMRIEFLRTADETDGALLEYEVTGHPRGFPAQAHVHPAQFERHDVLAGGLRVALDGQERVLQPGDSITIPAGTPHRHYPAGEADGRVRVELRPALRTEQLLERLAELCADGSVGERGFLAPPAAARLLLDFPQEGRAARPPESVQRAFARVIVAATAAYLFVDEWDVAAPQEAVFSLLADGATYPDWWRPVYLDTQTEGPPELGRVSQQHFKGRLPYHLHTTSTITLYEPPHRIGAEVVGDLSGRGLWTLTPTAAGAHVRFDWEVIADRALLRVLTPVLRPVFRWNHAWAIARAIEGLEPAAQRGRPA